MRRYLLILVCLIPSSALAQITGVLVSTTPSQAIIQFNDPTTTFTLTVSESASYSPVVADLDTGKWGTSANNNAKCVNPAGITRQCLIGLIPNAAGKLNNLSIESTPLFYGRALRPNTLHYFKVVDGANTVTGTFVTPNLPLGKTYGEPAPIIGGSTSWQASTSYSPGNLVLDSNGYIEQAQGPGAGTSGLTTPAWGAPGVIIMDGGASGVNWKNIGTLFGFPSYFTAAQWSLTNPKLFQMRDPNTGLPIQFVTTPSDYTNDISNHSFTAVGTCSNWTNASNLLGNSAFATVTTNDKCAVIQGNTSFTIGGIYYTDAVQLIFQASSSNSGDLLDACVTVDGTTCVTPTQQFTLTGSNTTFCFPVTTNCGTTPRPKPWSSDWNAPLAPVLANTIAATSAQKPGTSGIGGNSNFGFLVWKDASASGTISARNILANVYASLHVAGGYPDGGEEWMCNHAGTVLDGNNVPGYLCLEGFASGRSSIFWINSATGEVRNLGEPFVPGTGTTAGLLAGDPTSPVTETFDAYASNIVYFTTLDAATRQKIHVISLTLPTASSTYNANASPNAHAPGTWADLTPDNPPTTYNLGDQVHNFDATFSPTTYHQGRMEGVSGYNGHSYFIIADLSGNQNAPGWIIAFDVNAANPARSGVVAATPTFVDANPTNSLQVGCRWCGFHTVHNPGDTHFVWWAAHPASAQAIGGGFGTDITAGKLDASIDASQLTFQIDVSSNFLQAPLVNDVFDLDDGLGTQECFQIASISAGGASNQPGFSVTYSVTVTQRGFTMGGACSSTARSHSAAASMQMFCWNNYSGGKSGLFWWDFLGDPHGTNASPGMLLQTDGIAAHAAYTAAGTGNVTAGSVISESANWSTCNNLPPQTNCPGGALTTTGQPPFNITTVDTGGNTFQRHPTSIHQVLASLLDLLWGSDIQVANGVSEASPVSLTLVSGNLYSFKPGSSSIYTYNYKSLATIAVAGFHPLIDVSGPSSVIDGTTASAYKWCYAYLAGECVMGSVAGTAYANAPFLTSASFCGNGGAPAFFIPYSESELCLMNYGGLAESIVQVNLTSADSTGANSRSVGIGMSTMGFRNGYANPQPDPPGKDLFFPVMDANGRDDVMEMLIPPFPPTDSTARNDFIQKTVSSGTPPGGTVSAMVEFGYDTNLQATSRAENTVAVSSTYNQSAPFYFESSDSYTRPGCASGCSVILPIIPSHVVFYRWKFCSNASGACTIAGLSQISLLADTSANSAMTFNPQPVSFGTVNVGSSSSPQTVTVTNSGTINLIFSAGAVSISGANAGDFSFSSDTCSSQTVVPGGTCTFSVTFSPTVVGLRNASVVVTDVTDSISGNDSMSGTGLGSRFGAPRGLLP